MSANDLPAKLSSALSHEAMLSLSAEEQHLKVLAEKVLQARQSGGAAPADVNQPLPKRLPEAPVLTEATLETRSFLQMAVVQNVSDIHLRVGQVPIIRKDGDMFYTKLPPLSLEALQHFVTEVAPENIRPFLDDKKDADFSFQLPGMARFRANWFYEMGNPALVLRIVKHTIPGFKELGLPPVLEQFTQLHKGLVLITGPTGSGKSSTLAAMLNLINQKQSKHIITLEDPIEFVYTNQRSVFTQRQLGTDTLSFADGLKYALRQDPDVILLGEMRDRQTINSALHAAETGHLVFSTLHTINAVQTIHRMINVFEPHEREMVRKQIASVLQGTVSQRLVKRADGKGRVCIAEIMVVTPTVRDYIYRDQTEDIYPLLSKGEYDGACSLNQALHAAYREKLITEEEVFANTENESEMRQLLRGFYSGSN